MKRAIAILTSLAFCAFLATPSIGFSGEMLKVKVKDAKTLDSLKIKIKDGRRTTKARTLEGEKIKIEDAEPTCLASGIWVEDFDFFVRIFNPDKMSVKVSGCSEFGVPDTHLTFP